MSQNCNSYRSNKLKHQLAQCLIDYSKKQRKETFMTFETFDGFVAAGKQP